MISDEDVKQLFQSNSKHWRPNQPLCTEFYRGIAPNQWENQHPGRCYRHMSVFVKFNVIAEYCFDCYKVQIEPRTVVELFKLMMLFEQLKLENDNTRKCCVECREQIPGTYKGLIYCRELEEGETICKMLKEMVSGEISEKIPVFLKHGCSEYAPAYPEYARIEKGVTTMEYKPEWRVYEELADKEFVINSKANVIDTYNSETYTPQDVTVMVTWLVYAATIGDLSYLKISGTTVQPAENLNRPRFQPVEDE